MVAGITPVIRSTSGSDSTTSYPHPVGVSEKHSQSLSMAECKLLVHTLPLTCTILALCFYVHIPTFIFKGLFKCLRFLGAQSEAEANARNAERGRPEKIPGQHPDCCTQGSYLGISSSKVTDAIKVSGFQCQHSSFKDRDTGCEGASRN